MTITKVDPFTFDSDSGELTGPAEFMGSDEYKRCIERIENGTDPVFRAGVEHSPNLETALLVAVHTCYASWHGSKVFFEQTQGAS